MNEHVTPLRKPRTVIGLLNELVNGEGKTKYIMYKNRLDGSFKLTMVCVSNLIHYLDRGELELTDTVWVTKEAKESPIPEHIDNNFIQSMGTKLIPSDVKHIAHKVNEIINYLQHIRKEDNNEKDN